MDRYFFSLKKNINKMKNNIKQYLETHCELYWWNMGKKTLSFRGDLGNLLKKENIIFSIRKTEIENVFTFHFKSSYGISFKQKGTVNDFTHLAKLSIQMELVRMGDKSQLYVCNTWRPYVNVNL